MRRSALLALAAAGLAVAGCGGSSGDDARTATTAGTTAEPVAAMTHTDTIASKAAKAPRRGAVVKVVDSQFGRVLADRHGEALYLFDKEDARRSECYDDCAGAWPPLLARGLPRAGRGAAAGLLGTTVRRDGRRQVTYDGHPLYYYLHDAPGKILCHDVVEYGGRWLVVAPSGTARS